MEVVMENGNNVALFIAYISFCGVFFVLSLDAFLERRWFKALFLFGVSAIVAFMYLQNGDTVLEFHFPYG
jgi:hypothetical protein